MTREEALEELDTLFIPRDGEQDKLADAFEMAIEALSQQTGDAISRQAAIDALMGDVSEMNYGFYYAEKIELLPSVNPQPKTGHWIEHPEIKTSSPEYLMFYGCSECGDKQCFCKPDIHKKHFCTNCGARMVEPQESEDKND